MDTRFLPNIAWSIGNGHSIDIFHDIWIPAIGPLHHHLIDHTAIYRGLSFADLLTEEGTWDIQRLSDLFPGWIVLHILAIKCPSSIDGNDQCVWRWTPKQNFELQSAYCVLSGSLWSEKQSIWPLI
ncbi:hypothetical protein V6N12_004020 [Hibiscus sabdariffa]|uniref:Uncharacterized protein n=1 Tax=Hibiscus sabdariffa TaxID=183260 RepID=A0ABR2CM08_9ROSI